MGDEECTECGNVEGSPPCLAVHQVGGLAQQRDDAAYARRKAELQRIWAARCNADGEA